MGFTDNWIGWGAIILNLILYFVYLKYFKQKSTGIDAIKTEDLSLYAAYYIKQKESDKCFMFYDKMLVVFKDDRTKYKEAIWNYALASYYFGNNKKAIDLLKMYSNMNLDEIEKMNANLLLGIFYGELGDLENAFKYLSYNYLSDKLNEWRVNGQDQGVLAEASILYRIYFLSENNMSDAQLDDMQFKFGKDIKNDMQNEKIIKYPTDIIIYIYWLWKIQNNHKLCHQLIQYFLRNYKFEKMYHQIHPSQISRVQIVYYIIAQFYNYCEDEQIQNDKLALEFYNKLLNVRPFYALGHYHEAVLLLKTKEYALSLGSLEKAYKINPDIPIIKKNYLEIRQVLNNHVQSAPHSLNDP